MHGKLCGRRCYAAEKLSRQGCTGRGEAELEWRKIMPEDPIILLSYVNLKLRDFYSSLEAMCKDLDVSKSGIEEKLNGVGYRYDAEKNQFI